MLTTALAIMIILACFQVFMPTLKLSLKSVASVLLLSVIVSTQSFAQEVAPIVADPTVPPEWLSGVLIWIASIPKVGPIVVEVFKWLGVIASVFTALSVALTVIAKIPELALRFAKLPELADKVAKFNEKIQPYFKYLSIFNIKK